MKEAKRLGRWALVAALSASCAFACGDDDDDAPIGTAGSGGKGGSGGTAGSGGAGADGGVGGGGGSAGQVPDVAWCGPYPLEELCDNASKPCPEDLDALLARDLCEGAENDRVAGPPGASKVSRFETRCGGTIVVAEYELYSKEWEFAEDGQLLGVLNHTDAYRECEDTGSSSASTLYGAKPCERIDAAPTVVCTHDGEGGAGGASGAGGGGAGGGGAGGSGAGGGGAGGAGD